MTARGGLNPYAEGCPTRLLLDRIADKWTMLVIGAMACEQSVRFTELRRRVDGISQKMLTQTLRQLERDGLVVRRVYAVVPPRVEYTITPLGTTLRAPMRALEVWATEHMADVAAAQTVFDARAGADATDGTPLNVPRTPPPAAARTRKTSSPRRPSPAA